MSHVRPWVRIETDTTLPQLITLLNKAMTQITHGLQDDKLNAVTAAVTLDSSYVVVDCDASGGAFTVTLPAAATMSPAHFFDIKNSASSGVVTVDANGAETIDGNLTIGLNPYEAIRIRSNGVGWGIY